MNVNLKAALLVSAIATLGASGASAGEILWWTPNWGEARAKELGLNDLRINASGCLERCELGPTMVIYPEGVWYSCKTPADIDEVLVRHVQKGERVPRLMLRPEDGPPLSGG